MTAPFARGGGGLACVEAKGMSYAFSDGGALSSLSQGRDMAPTGVQGSAT